VGAVQMIARISSFASEMPCDVTLKGDPPQWVVQARARPRRAAPAWAGGRRARGGPTARPCCRGWVVRAGGAEADLWSSLAQQGGGCFAAAPACCRQCMISSAPLELRKSYTGASVNICIATNKHRSWVSSLPGQRACLPTITSASTGGATASCGAAQGAARAGRAWRRSCGGAWAWTCSTSTCCTPAPTSLVRAQSTRR